jgi:hypothetical protein
MAALTQDIVVTRQSPSRPGSYPIAADTVIYDGALVCLDATGFAIPGADTAGITHAVGVAKQNVDNTGGDDGDLQVPVRYGCPFLLAESGVVQADMGRDAFISDDQTVVASGTSNSRRAGRFLRFEDGVDGKVWVFLNAPLGDVVDTSVGTADIENLAVTTAKLDNDAVTGAKLADDAVDSEHIAADSLDAEHYAPGSVDTTALAAAAVTGDEIADDAIDSEHLAAGALDTEHYAAASVTTAKLSAELRGETQLLSGPGAINLTARTTRVTATGTGDALTLADGTITGQRKTIILEALGGGDTAVLTAGGSLHLGNGIASITFDAAFEWVELEWSDVDTSWMVVSIGGATIA